MTRDTITALPDPSGFSADPLTDLIRTGARQLIEQALEAELGALLAQFADDMIRFHLSGKADCAFRAHPPPHTDLIRPVIPGYPPTP